ncbi:hypothetical protein GGD82_000869 [Roseospira marina]|nr:hypothetical protein [Roseospira marina]
MPKTRTDAWTILCPLLPLLLFVGCTPTRTAPTDPPPCACPAIPAELLTCPPGAPEPTPTLRGLLEALTIERTAGETCRAKMRAVLNFRDSK